jgi:hypothetical protein
MQTHINHMGKVQLRAACRDAKVKNYSKMTVATMRAALTALQPIAPMETAFKEVKRAEKDKPAREERNGVKRPLDPTSKCGQVWAWLDKHPDADAAAVKAQAEKVGWNLNNASIEFSYWRRFMGIAKKEAA